MTCCLDQIIALFSDGTKHLVPSCSYESCHISWGREKREALEVEHAARRMASDRVEMTRKLHQAKRLAKQELEKRRTVLEQLKDKARLLYRKLSRMP